MELVIDVPEEEFPVLMEGLEEVADREDGGLARPARGGEPSSGGLGPRVGTGPTGGPDEACRPETSWRTQRQTPGKVA